MTINEKMLRIAKEVDKDFPMSEYEVAIVVTHAKNRDSWVIANRRGDAKYDILHHALHGKMDDRIDIETKGQ